MGKVLRVDSVYGNDSTASPGGSPYLTVNAAVSAATSGNTVWVLPGTYNLTSPITIPSGVCIRGLNIQTCTLQMLGVTANTNLITMGDNTRIEDLTLKLTSSDHYTLRGVYYTGGTSVTSKVRTCVITVDNSAASGGGTSNVYGIECAGTGTLGAASFSFNGIKGSTINVYSNGGGNKRGILISNTNILTTRDTNIYVAQPTTPITSTGSYVGVETADSNNTGSIQLRSTTIGVVIPTTGQTYSASDILQTNPSSVTNPTYLASAGIQLGPGTDLVTKTAGQKPFSTYMYPTTLFYGCLGTISNTKEGWLWPGTMIFQNSNPKYPDSSLPPAHYRAQQPFILSGISVSCNASPGGTNTLVITVCKNPDGTTTGTYPVIPNGATSYSLTLTGGSLTGSYYNSSVNFAAGDKLSVYLQTNSSTVGDMSIQLDCF
jgi:hypothetical protein